MRGARRREQRAESRKQRAEIGKHRVGKREQGLIRSTEQRAGSRVKSREQKPRALTLIGVYRIRMCDHYVSFGAEPHGEHLLRCGLPQ
jgi:hypothetical protein